MSEVLLYTPTEPTLKKYGLTIDDWLLMARQQGGRCGVCDKEPNTGRLVIDHEHVRGWKAMPPERRKLYVRGLVCWWCNHYYLGRGITIAKAEGVVRFLKAYAERRPT